MIYPATLFEEKSKFILDNAQKLGADACRVILRQNDGITVEVREGEIETCNRELSLSVDISVLRAQAKGYVSLGEWSEPALINAIKTALDITTFTEADEYFGLPEPTQYATVSLDDITALALDDDENADVDWLSAQAQQCEKNALEHDSRIMSDGAQAGGYRSYCYRATSNGFAHGYRESLYNLSVSVLARDSDDQQSHYAYDLVRARKQLRTPSTIGIEAAQRSIAMLRPQRVRTGKYPIVLSANVAIGFIYHLLDALSGAAQYRQLSFLHNTLGMQILPRWLSLVENPKLPGAIGSAPFDAEGLSCNSTALVNDGIIMHYLLDTYAARRLNLAPTGNAGGVHNLFLRADKAHTATPDELLANLRSGLLVTRLMGSSINRLTGDYSRGASGFWIENGQIAYPVDNLTIAGNLRDMFASICAIGTDVDCRSRLHIPSLLLSAVAVGSQ